MDDILKKLAQDFVEEASVLTEQISTCFLTLDQAGRASALEDPAQEAMRALHTLKGSAGMIGLDGIVAVAHALEEMLSFAGGLRRFGAATADLLIEGGDLLRKLVHEAPARGASADGAAEAFFARSRRLSEAPFNQGMTFTELEEGIEALLASISRERAPGAAPAATDAETVRVKLRQLDQMIDLVDELVTLESQIARSTQDLLHRHGETREVSRLESATAPLRKVVMQLQRSLLAARLMPVSTLSLRFSRYVRDLARERGQPIRFVTEGGDTPIDKAIIERLDEPLLHLVRNAVAHGLEPPEARASMGKPAEATITLAARCLNDRVAITVADDGRGLEMDAIVARARSLGYDPRGLSPQAALELIFMTGFSTAASVSTLAGRGVGLDVVATTVRELGGHIEVQSAPGKGAQFTLNVPITLAMIKVLLVEVDGETFALPTSYVVESLRVEAGALHEILQLGVLSFRDQVVHVVDGGALLDTPDRRAVTRRYCVLLAVGARRRGVLIDRLVGYQAMVVKPLDPVLGPLRRIAGAAVLGDGRVVLVLDLAEILDSPLAELRSGAGDGGHRGAPAAAAPAQRERAGAERRDEVGP
jgi:two-component system chemotaxis sensor kinase CheA